MSEIIWGDVITIPREVDLYGLLAPDKIVGLVSCDCLGFDVEYNYCPGTIAYIHIEPGECCIILHRADTTTVYPLNLPEEQEQKWQKIFLKTFK